MTTTLMQRKASYFGHIMRNGKHNTLQLKIERKIGRRSLNSGLKKPGLIWLRWSCSELQWIKLEALMWSPMSLKDKKHTKKKFIVWLFSICKAKLRVHNEYTKQKVSHWARKSMIGYNIIICKRKRLFGALWKLVATRW